MRNECSDWFKEITEITEPHPWQIELMDEDEPKNRLIRIPTGFGKTAGVTLAWLFHRVKKDNPAWPLRLVICLPMRTLVEQTEKSVRSWVEKTGLLWDGDPSSRPGRIGVHSLMGGVAATEWHLYPEEKAILIGTQDMLLSRALNRGYAAPRARWPMEFGLINQDVLWILDEGQLMDVGLRTSSQLQQFRNERNNESPRPAYSWWMSATLQPEWLATVDNQKLIELLVPETLTIAATQRSGELWDVRKPVETMPCDEATQFAEKVLEAHALVPDGPHGRITLVIVNTVGKAREIWMAIAAKRQAPQETRLIHSRFRGMEKKTWQHEFLAREFCVAGVDRIVVATQVVEAGVDISAGCLITEVAPWSSLVQRFGRAARYGGAARVVVAHASEISDENASPYQTNDLKAALSALQRLEDVSPSVLEAFEETLSADERKVLYPGVDGHVLASKDIDELFDTTPDLTGADLDIGRFIRSGTERDCLVFWGTWEGELPSSKMRPTPDALCSVPFIAAREWLFKKSQQIENGRAFVFDYLEDAWRKPKPYDILPGRVVLVDHHVGGYDIHAGFTGKKLGKNDSPVSELLPPVVTPDEMADAGQDDESLSAAEKYQTIATHGMQVAATLNGIAAGLLTDKSVETLCGMAARVHDLGKAHPAFRACIRAADAPRCADLAKAPNNSWVDLRERYRTSDTTPRRKGFRHELASTLALLELLARVDQQHPALLAPYQELIDQHFMESEIAPALDEGISIGEELRALSQQEFDLLLYLVCAHHGKVRGSLHACPADQDYPADDARYMPIRGIQNGDTIPSVRVYDSQGELCNLPALSLHLAPAHLGLSSRYGASWRDRTLSLLRHHGPFALAWLEALLRAADIRASRESIADPLLTADAANLDHPVMDETIHSSRGE